MIYKSSHPYITTSEKRVVFLRYRGGLIESSSDNIVSERNPKGLTRFIYDDYELAKSILGDMPEDADFNRFYECIYEVKDVIRDKKKGSDTAY